MTTAFLTHRFVRLALAAVAVALAVTTTVNAQQAATYEVVSSFVDVLFRNGRSPSSLRQADDGTFYGTTRSGGTFDRGTLFRMDATGVVTTVESFSSLNGRGPFGLVKATDGRFYGLTQPTDADNRPIESTVFRFVPGGGLTTLHAFQGLGRQPVDLFAASDG